MMGWYHDGMGMGMGGWILMTLAIVAFWALVVLAVIAIFRGARSTRTTPDDREPIQILDERFARGEIDEEEYHARRGVLAASAQYRPRPGSSRPG